MPWGRLFLCVYCYYCIITSFGQTTFKDIHECWFQSFASVLLPPVMGPAEWLCLFSYMDPAILSALPCCLLTSQHYSPTFIWLLLWAERSARQQLLWWSCISLLQDWLCGRWVYRWSGPRSLILKVFIWLGFSFQVIIGNDQLSLEPQFPICKMERIVIDPNL